MEALSVVVAKKEIECQVGDQFVSAACMSLGFVQVQVSLPLDLRGIKEVVRGRRVKVTVEVYGDEVTA